MKALLPLTLPLLKDYLQSQRQTEEEGKAEG